MVSTEVLFVVSLLLLGICKGIVKKPKNASCGGVRDGGGVSVRLKISARFAREGVQVHFTVRGDENEGFRKTLMGCTNIVVKRLKSSAIGVRT